MKEIVKTLLMEGIDEETIHKVLDVIEEEYEVIDEFNVPPSVINDITQRKADKINTNTSLSNYHKKFARQDQTEFHNSHPNATTQDRHNYQTKHQEKANQLDQQGARMREGGARISSWIRKKVDSGDLNRNDVKTAHNNMTAAMRKNRIEQFEN